AADALPGGLAIEDVFIREQRGAVGADHLLRDRRCLAIDLAAEPAEYAEGHAEHGDQHPPEFAVLTHVAPPRRGREGAAGCFPGGCAASGRGAARPGRGTARATCCRHWPAAACRRSVRRCAP